MKKTKEEKVIDIKEQKSINRTYANIVAHRLSDKIVVQRYDYIDSSDIYLCLDFGLMGIVRVTNNKELDTKYKNNLNISLSDITKVGDTEHFSVSYIDKLANKLVHLKQEKELEMGKEGYLESLETKIRTDIRLNKLGKNHKVLCSGAAYSLLGDKTKEEIETHLEALHIV